MHFRYILLADCARAGSGSRTQVKQVTISTGVVKDIVGSTCGTAVDHYLTSARFKQPLGIAYHLWSPAYTFKLTDRKERLYVADWGNNKVRYVLPEISYAGTLIDIAKPRDVTAYHQSVFVLCDLSVSKVRMAECKT